MSERSVGIVEKKQLELTLDPGGFKLSGGAVLKNVSVTYESYGTLSATADNVVYICHALTGDSHVAGKYSEDEPKPGWWDEMVGPGKGIDTDYYFVVCSNILGGCQGTTGPSSINPDTGRPYGSSFPEISVKDIVGVQKLLLEELGVKRLAAVIGGSFGGMQVLEWGLRHTDYVDRCICVAAGLSLTSQALAFDAVARDAIICDPAWNNGDYYDSEKAPDWGLAHARKIAHITYLSPEIMQQKFGRHRADGPGGYRYQVESYLGYQGNRFLERFDANSYLSITGAMDSFDLLDEFGGYAEAFANVKSRFLVIGLSSDWLFPPEQSVELANILRDAGKHVSCCILQAPHGHDAFLIEVDHLSDLVRAFLPWVSSPPETTVVIPPERAEEHRLITAMIKENSKILDLGCGDGTLLSLLEKEKNTQGAGIEINLEKLVSVIDKGHDAFQVDLDNGFSDIPDQTYDYAILGSTLQVVRKPQAVLKEMLRVAREGIVTFPNFAYWQYRVSLGLAGHMPKSKAIPYEWYETPNIHLTTRLDFIDLCATEGIEILDMICLPGKDLFSRLLVSMRMCNIGAERILARLSLVEKKKDGEPGCSRQ